MFAYPPLNIVRALRLSESEYLFFLNALSVMKLVPDTARVHDSVCTPRERNATLILCVLARWASNSCVLASNVWNLHCSGGGLLGVVA